MDFDQLVVDVFGTSDLSALSADRIVAGVGRLRERFETEDDPDDRFAVWCLLRMLRAAPDPEDAFDDEEDREAARDFTRSIDQDGQG